jgi:hypothetical protein
MLSFYTAAAIVSALCHQSDAFHFIGSRLTHRVRIVPFPKVDRNDGLFLLVLKFSLHLLLLKYVLLVFSFQSLKMVDVVAYTDSDPITARGTPMARPKIGDSIVDVIGRTPMV